MSKCKDDLEREFYIKMTKKFGWAKNVLIHQVESRAYERFLLNQTNFDQSLPEKEKDRIIVEYALKDTTPPIGVYRKDRKILIPIV